MRPCPLKALTVALLLWGGGAAPAGAAGLPSTLNFQGRMRLSSGANVADSNSHTLGLAIYNQSSGGTALWSEVQTGVSTVGGLLNVQVGSVSPIFLPFDEPYWLGVNFDGDGEMTPRTPLTLAPYAFRAKLAEGSVGPLSATAALSPGVVYAQNNDSAGAGVYGVGKPGFSMSVGVKGIGGNGVWGEPNAPSGIGVRAEQGSGAYALWVNGNAQFNSGTVDFSGATVTGLPAAGEANTASNLGSGQGVFNAKSGVDLQFKSIAAADSSVGVSSDPFQVNISANADSALWNAARLQGVDVSAAAPSTGDALVYNGAWQPGPVDAKKIAGYDVTAAGPFNGQVLSFNGGQWANSYADAHAIYGYNVAASAPTSGDVLYFSGGQWVNGPANAKQLDGSPVMASAPVTGDSLVYNGGQWTNGGAEAKYIGGQGVMVTAPMAGQVLGYDGSQWVNQDADARSIRGYGVVAGLPSNGDTLNFSAGSWNFGPASAGQLKGVNLSGTAPNDGQVLTYNSGSFQWEPAYPAAPVAPLSLTLNAAGAAPLYVLQQGSGAAVSAVASVGAALSGQSASGPGLLAVGIPAISAKGALDMNGQGRIINLQDPAAAQDAATKNYVDGFTGAFVLHSGDAMTGGLSIVSSGTALYANGSSLGISATGATYGVYGRSPSGYGVWGQTAGSGLTVGGVVGSNTGPGTGVVGQAAGGTGVYGTSTSGEGVLGESNSSSTGVHGISYSNGYGVQGHSNNGTGVYGDSAGGTGTAGVKGTAFGGGGVGVQGTGASGWGGSFQGMTGVSASGSSGPDLLLAGNGKVSTTAGAITMASYVSFTAGTNLGSGLALPYAGSGSAPTLSAAFSVTNTGGGYGVMGWASQPGALGGGSPDVNSPLSAGVVGRSGVSGSAGVAGFNTDTSGQSAGMVAIGGSLGLYARGLSAAAGLSAESEFGIAGRFQGKTGIDVSTTSTAGTALLVRDGGNSSARALDVQGSARFSGGAVSFTSLVDFTGATVLGLSGTVTAPLSLTYSSGAPFHGYGAVAGVPGINAAGVSRGLNASVSGPSDLVAVSASAQLTGSFQTAVALRGEASGSLSDATLTGVNGRALSTGGSSFATGGDFYASASSGQATGANVYSTGLEPSGVYVTAQGTGSGGISTRGLVAVAQAASTQPGIGVQANAYGGTVNTGVLANATGASSYGVAANADTVAVSATSAAGNAVFAQSNGSFQPTGYFIQGTSSGTAGSAIAVYGQARNSTAGIGIYGYNASVVGSFPSSGAAVYGFTDKAGSAGVWGRAQSNGVGVIAEGSLVALSATAAGVGSTGALLQGNFTGVSATVSGFSGGSTGVYGAVPLGAGSAGVAGMTQGSVRPSTAAGAGVLGVNDGINGVGVYAKNNGGGGVALVADGLQTAISATATSNTGRAVVATNTSNQETGYFGNQGAGRALRIDAGYSAGSYPVLDVYNISSLNTGPAAWFKSEGGPALLLEHANDGILIQSGGSVGDGMVLSSVERGVRASVNEYGVSITGQTAVSRGIIASVSSTNPAAEFANEAVAANSTALMLKGQVKLASNSTTTAAASTTLNAPNGTIRLTANLAGIANFVVNNNWLNQNSVVLVTIYRNGAVPALNYSVFINSSGLSFTIYFNPTISLNIGDQINFTVLNQ